MHKLLLLVFLILVLAGGSYFIIQKNHSFVRTQYSGPVETIKIANIGEYTIFNIIAKDKGYFDDFGLNAEIVEYPAGPPAVKALLEGEVDVAIAADFVGVSNFFTANDLRILSQVSKHYTFTLITNTDKGINEPADLEGKTIGVTKKGAGEFFLGRYLAFNSIAPTSVVIKDLPPADLTTQLEAGEVDAIVIFDPHAYRLLNNQSFNFKSWPIQGDLKTIGLLYSTDTYVSTHSDVVRRYMQVLAKADQFTKDNEEEAKSIIENRLNYEKDYVDYIWPRHEFKLALEQDLLLNMENEARWLISNNLTEEKTVPNYLDYIYFSALQEVKPNAVTIIH